MHLPPVTLHHAACALPHSWEDAQRARVVSIEKYRAAKGHEQKRALLKDVLVMAFHTLQPPDRVGGASQHPCTHTPSLDAYPRLCSGAPPSPWRLPVQKGGGEHLDSRPLLASPQDEVRHVGTPTDHASRPTLPTAHSTCAQPLLRTNGAHAAGRHRTVGGRVGQAHRVGHASREAVPVLHGDGLGARPQLQQLDQLCEGVHVAPRRRRMPSEAAQGVVLHLPAVARGGRR
jgi:hypothetical protein